ncbi:MAG: sulfotransferase [Chloroflexota bacterium]|nr:sulfotransferase [Chloroflexota bacterium]
MGWDDIDARWQQLNPVFVRGMQRSGTSIMGRALRRMNIAGFGEGHLWFDLVEPFMQLRDPAYHSHLREDEYALGQGRVAQLEKYIAVALDQFHRDHLSSDLKRWMDKSPGAEAVRIAPLLAELFPRSQFIFMYRNGITNVHSGIKFWADYPGIFQVMCQGWTETMSAWREVRKSLRGRYIEIAQEDMASQSLKTAICLTNFLGMPESRYSVVDLFCSNRVLSSFPDKNPGDYHYQIDWRPEQKAHFIEMCQEEMEIWGYEINFDSLGFARDVLPLPDGLVAIISDLNQRDARIAELEREYQALREHLARVEQGRVMRLLNWLHRWKPRLLKQDS